MNVNLYDEHTEQALLGCLMNMDKPQIYLPKLTEADFVYTNHQVILAAIKRLVAKRDPFDEADVAVECASDKNYRAAGTDNIVISCSRAYGSTAMVGKYFNQVKDLSNRRKLSNIGQAISTAAEDRGEDTAEIIARMVESLRGITTGRDAWVEMSDIMMQTLEDIGEAMKGGVQTIKTGVADLDYITGGLHNGEMTILAARPAVGKSALSMYMGMQAAKAGKKVGVCSLEMTPQQYAKRMVAKAAHVDGRKIRMSAKSLTQEELTMIGDSANELAGLQMPFTFSVRTIEDLAAEAMHRKDTKGLDMLIIDYLQLIGTKRSTSSQYEQTTEVSHQCKRLSVELNIPILALCQVSRPANKGVLTMPTMDSLRGSGDLEQDADNIILMHRPESADDPAVIHGDGYTYEVCKDLNRQYIVCDLAKHRNGERGRFAMIFDPAFMDYRCIERM